MPASVFVLLVGVTSVAGSDAPIDEGNCFAGSCSARDVALIQTTKPAVSQHVLQPEAGEGVGAHLPIFAQSSASALVTVVSYNLYWWNVASRNRWGSLYSRIKGEKPFHLIGFQECENVGDVLVGAGLGDFDSYQGPSKPQNNPAPLAWDRTMFEKVSGPSHKWVASDRYGGRYLTWVRLRHRASGEYIFFANTHGPLGNCGSTLGRNWVAGVEDNKEAGDTVFVTGDFNCGSGSSAMNLLKGALNDDGFNDVDGGIDQIITDFGQRESGGRREGYPSDHPLIKGTFRVGGGGGRGVGGDSYDWLGAPKVGSWGGRCKCPSGNIYEVGDNYDSCESLACVGGEVVEACGEDVISPARAGWKAVCGDAAAPQRPPTPVPSSAPEPARPGDYDVYEWVGAPKVGGWGGRCMCPSGVVYEVGDNYDSCGSVACVGGEVVDDCGQDVISATRDGWKVTCGGSSRDVSTPAPSDACAPFGDWPNVDSVTCGGCTALVLAEPFGGRCDTYCESFDHVCVRAAEEKNDNCVETKAARCDEEIKDTSDMLCTCLRA